MSDVGIDVRLRWTGEDVEWDDDPAPTPPSLPDASQPPRRPT